MQFLDQVKKWIWELTEIALLLVALGIAVEILFGNVVPFFGGIVTNLTNLLDTLGQNGLVGMLAMGVIVWLFNRRRWAEQQHHHQ